MQAIAQRDIMFRAVGDKQLADSLDLSGKQLIFPTTITSNVTGNVTGPGNSTFAGYVTTPGMPAFHAKSSQATASGNDVSGYTILFNRGSGLNATNGRFTSPASGVYFLRWHQLAANASTGEFRTAIYVNGSAYGGLRFITFKTAAGWLSLIAEGHLYLNENDYATIRYESGPSALYADGNYGAFSGHFIG
jgi:hypothetical protein